MIGFGFTKIFKPLRLPKIVNQNIKDIGPTEAKITANVVRTGNVDILAYGHCWSTNPIPTIADNNTDLGNVLTPGEFTLNLTNLIDGTIYYYCPYFKTIKGIQYGEIESFTAENPRKFVVPSGSGTLEYPYLITSLENLNWISASDTEVASPNYVTRMGKCYRLCNDLDLYKTKWTTYHSGQGWEPIGKLIPRFVGLFDGYGKTIRNLYINRTSAQEAGISVGFIGVGGTGGNVGSQRIRDLKLLDVDIATKDMWTGPIAGRLMGCSMGGCITTGVVHGTWGCGGLVGQIDVGSITSSYAIVDVYGTNSAYNGSFIDTIISGGGSLISRCYSLGKTYINGILSTTKGFCGTSTGSSTIEKSFWDKEASGASSSYGSAIGLTTAQCKQLATLMNIGFQMKNKVQTGTYNIGNNRNNGYPFLNYEYPTDPAPSSDAVLAIDNNTVLKIEESTILEV